MRTENDARRLRLFFALSLSEEVRARLREEQCRLRPHLSHRAARWTRPEGMHVTLRFLGATPAERVADLVAGVRAALAGLAPMELECRGLGCFPPRGAARVLWAGVGDPIGSLALVQQRVAAAADRVAGSPEAAAFHGHVTLARLKRPTREELRHLREWVEDEAARPFGRWTCTAVELLESTLSPSGSRYTLLESLPL